MRDLIADSNPIKEKKPSPISFGFYGIILNEMYTKLYNIKFEFQL